MSKKNTHKPVYAGNYLVNYRHVADGLAGPRGAKSMEVLTVQLQDTVPTVFRASTFSEAM